MSRRLATAGLLLAWAAAGTVVGAGLMRRHWVPLPVAAAGDQVRPATGEWTALHALSPDCACSRRVLARLAGRGPVSGVRERVLWVSAGGDPPAVPDGFEVECHTAESVAAAHRIEAVPVLLVVAPDGRVRYCGGYTARKQGYDVLDRRIISAVRDGESVSPLPVYGCATSERLRAATALLPARTRGDVP